jgi:glycosyltransferase involved in cell wall biosynthesis
MRSHSVVRLEKILPVYNSEWLTSSESPSLRTDDLWPLYEHLNKRVNSNQFDEAAQVATKLNVLLQEFCGVACDAPVNELIERLLTEDLPSCFDTVHSAINLFSGTLYAQALISMLNEQDYQSSKKHFSHAFCLLEVSSKSLELDLLLRQRLWRSSYHAGLASFLADDFDMALKTFERLFTLPAFRQALYLLDEKRLALIAGAEQILDIDVCDIPSDVVSGVLYYYALTLMKGENYKGALPLLRAAACLAGNPVSAGFKSLAEVKLPACYSGLIKKNTLLGKGPMSASARVTVTFNNRSSFPARTIFENDSSLSTLSVTAIVPVYNGSKLVAQTLQSIITQTLPPTELVVVDDGSEDDSFDVISNAVSQFNFPFDVIIIRTMNGGQSRARNFGAVAATGTLMAYLDQDDLWYPPHLQALQKPFSKNNKLGWTYSNLDEIDLSGKMMHRKFLNVVAPNRRFSSVRDLLHTDMFILPSASLISRAALMSIKGFDEELSGYEDDDLFVRLFRDGFEHIFVDVPLSSWRIHQGSCSYQMWMVVSRRKFHKKLAAMFPDDPSMGRFWVRDVISPRFFANGVNRFNVGIETNDYAMCTEALTDMKTSMETMIVPIHTRLRVLMCHFPVIYKRFRTLRTHIKFK